MSETEKTIYITLQGKGGVSKTTTTVWMHQYFKSKGISVKGFDTDPNNATYAAFSSLDVETIKIMDEKHNIEPRKFDTMVEEILASKEEIILIDNGATSFNPILSYLSENDTFNLFKEYGIKTILSTVCIGGSEHIECMKGIHYLFETTKVPIIVWLNHYFGEMPGGKIEPVGLLEKALKDRLLGIVNIPNKNANTFGKDIQKLMGKRCCFNDCIEDEKEKITKKHRIKTFMNELYSELERLEI